MKYLSVILMAFTMVGCSLVPDSLEVADKNTLVSYVDVAANPEEKKGETVRWGGVIANIENKQDITVVEVVQLPIYHYGRPIVAKNSLGRYRVYIEDFLDPVVYQPGRSITFVGDVTGLETGAIGEHTYFYPTIKASSHELWSEEERIDIRSYHPHFGFPYSSRFGFRRGFFGSRFGHRGFFGSRFGHHGFSRQRVTIHRNPFRDNRQVKPSEPENAPKATKAFNKTDIRKTNKKLQTAAARIKSKTGEIAIP